MYEVAKRYVDKGISLVPVASDGSKQPATFLLPKVGKRYMWQVLMERPPTDEELRKWYSENYTGSLTGMAVVCGAISANHEVIDIDWPDIVDEWLATVREANSTLFERLVLVNSPRPGLHCHYRASSLNPPKVLAAEVVPSLGTNKVSQIEIRGNKCLCIVPPTPTTCHPNKVPYVYRTDRTLLDIETISEEERVLLYEVCKTFEQRPSPRERSLRSREVHHNSERKLDRRRPDHDFEYKQSWIELLEQHGWTCQGEGTDSQHWCRPGKTDSVSGTLDFMGNGLFHVFTSSVSGLEQQQSYTKFGFYAAVEFDGNREKAKAALQANGYGQPKLINRPRRFRRGSRKTR